MAVEDVKNLIQKSMHDSTFRTALYKNFDQTVATHQIHLTPLEREALIAVDWTAPLPNFTSSGTWVHIYKVSQD
jgi:hypothetical protein